MPRPIRHEEVNCWYHVMNRGASNRHVFLNDEMKEIFLCGLESTVKKYDIEIHAFCIMGNHYHLLIRLKKKNLSKALQYLNSVYAKKYNVMRHKDGPVFKSRFTSIWINTEKYLKNVVRYIHYNPVLANIVDSPDKFSWSSYNDYISDKKNFMFLSTYLFRNKEQFVTYTNKGIDQKTIQLYEKIRLPSVI